MADVFLHDLRYALRALRSSPGFALVAIFSLALGIGANTAIFSLIDAVILKTLPVQHPEELLQVNMGGPDDDSFTNPIWEQVRDHQDVFRGVFAFGGARFNLAPGGEARFAQSNWVSGDFFNTLGVHAALGRTFTPDDDRRGCAGTAILTYDFWQREYGGRADVLEKPISIDNHPFQVIGVAPPGFYGVEIGRQLDVLVPICTEAIVRADRSQLDQRSSWWLRVMGRPKAGLDPRQVTARLKTIAPQVFAATEPPYFGATQKLDYRKKTFDTAPGATGLSNLRAQYRQALLVLMVIVGVVLIIACANVANLLLARATARQREIAIRMALGSGRGRLIRQLLTESMLLALGGAVLGLLFAKWGTRLLVGFLSRQNNQAFLDLSLNLRVLAFTAAVAMLTALLFGLIPALRGTRVEPQAAMKENARGLHTSGLGGRSRFSIGKLLVMTQVALSLVLLAAGGLLLGSFRKLATLDPGFDPDRVLLMQTDLRNANFPKERLTPKFLEILDQLRATPGVRSASVSSMTPVSGSSWNGMIKVDGFVPQSRRDALVWFNRVSTGFFESFGTPILAGRDFGSQDVKTAPLVAIINQSMARKFFGNKNPLGRVYRDDWVTLGPPITVIGVVADAKYQNLREAPRAAVYLPLTQNDDAGVSMNYALRVSSGPVTNVIDGAKAAVEAVSRDVSIEFRTLSTQVAESLNRERLLASLSGFFSALALLLATIGLYGVMAYNVARRRGEIGIRMALGAGARRVLGMVLAEVVVLAAGGLAIGLGGALASTRVLEDQKFLYGMTARDPWTLGLAGMVLAVVGVIAGFLPARRAARLDPMVALREE
jgi:predicted permease